MTNHVTPIPEGLDLLTDYQGVTIRRKWYNPIAWGLLIFAICWDSFLINWYAMAGHIKGGDPMTLIFFIFPLGHVAVGVGLTYFCLCLFCNTTDLLLRPDHLEITTYPLPWLGSKTIPRQELTGFIVREKHSQTKSGRSVSYKVSYVDATNHEKSLLGYVSNREQADYICNYLSQYYQVARS